MKSRLPVCLTVLFIVLLSTAVWADQIILKDGTVYSGKFIRGDANLIDFRVLGRVESFNTAEVSRIVFGERESEKSADTPSKATPKASLPDIEPTSPIVEKPKPQSVRSQSVPPSSPVSNVTVPKGMALIVRTTTEIDTERNRVGDPFEAILDEDLLSGTQTVANRGSLLKGKIAYAKESGKLTGQSQLVLELTDMVANGKTYPLRSSDYTEMGASRGNRTAATVGGTAALGAIIGAIAGGGKGAAIGGVSGAAVGTGVQVITRGEVLRIPAETVLEFRLEAPLVIDIP